MKHCCVPNTECLGAKSDHVMVKGILDYEWEGLGLGPRTVIYSLYDLEQVNCEYSLEGLMLKL